MFVYLIDSFRFLDYEVSSINAFVNNFLSSYRERVVNSTRGTLEEVNIQSLRPGARYVLRVVAYNENGAGDSSEPLTVKNISFITTTLRRNYIQKVDLYACLFITT